MQQNPNLYQVWGANASNYNNPSLGGLNQASYAKQIADAGFSARLIGINTMGVGQA